MILVGNQRGGSRDLARHLLKEENEHVAVHELRGFASDDLESALGEAYAISRGTRCRQFLYSLSLNPPRDENVSTEAFEDAIARVEKRLGLANQPRAIVFHEKEGRRHCHAVWSRIDTDAMKAVQLSHTKRKLQDLSRELYRDHGWKMPPGLMSANERDPRSFTLAEWQQAKRNGGDPRAVKTLFQECWAVSDTQGAFASALRERGYILARGDRRGFVAVDHRGEVYSISRWTGKRAKDIRGRLTDEKSLPSVEKARADMAKDMAHRLSQLKEQEQAAIAQRTEALEEKRRHMARRHQEARRVQREQQEQRAAGETRLRQERYSKGLRGLVDRVTGRHQKIRKQNERETYLAHLRDQQERDTLIFNQLGERRTLQARIERLREFGQHRADTIEGDRKQYREISSGTRDKFDRIDQRVRQRSRRGPERGR